MWWCGGSRVIIIMSVCVSVCPLGYLWNHTRDIYQIFVACCLYVRPWYVLFQHADDSRTSYRREGGDGSAHSGEV